MEVLRTWIIGVTVSAMVLAAAQALMPEGPIKRVGRLTGGLILVLALLHPLVSLEYADLPDLRSELTEGTKRGEETAMKSIIEQELAAYIVDKGVALGAEVTAAVTCVPDENGVPIPQKAVVTGSLAPNQRDALSALVKNDLGIPIEGQFFQEV